MTTADRPSRLRRSELSTPGHSAKMITKASSSDADLVFLDLEDAVAPSAKDGARATIVAGLNELDWGTKTRAVRVNAVGTRWCHDDLTEVISGAGRNVDVVIVPKIKGPREVWFVDDLLTGLETKLGLEVGRIGIEVLIEETEALARVNEIAGCSPRLEALILGVGDLSASQGIRIGHIGGSADGADGLGYPGDIWHYARNQVIVAARSHGIDAVDGPFADIKSPEAYRREATWASTLGAVGKWAIHPSQVPVANEVFAPSPDEIKQALEVVEAMHKAEAEGLGAASYNGMMIDAATSRVFEGVLDRARRCGVLA
ncbi:CoA ester lyase [Pseudonocardia xishanensis]|uniref:CoA ester lyase n=1 Tax=Pseudonocardia xishanensis TaxID=630995 RepID=A0ABP8RVB3_9PSEU